MKRLLSRQNPLSHYKWGDNCDGWNFVEENALSIKEERMPPQTSEKLHFHMYAEQFFYILNGQANFIIEEMEVELKAGEGITITAGQKHKIMNRSQAELSFLLSSFPSAKNDRTDCE